MNESNFASLSAGLLARKGQAKPAMRPQLYKFADDDDLGWNDMGTDMLTPEQKQALMPAQPNTFGQDTAPHQMSPQKAAVAFDDMPTPPQEPVVNDTTDTVERSIEDKVADVLARHAAAVPAAEEPVEEQPAAKAPDVQEETSVEPRRSLTAVAPSPYKQPRAAAGSKSKAAFTLRLDPERHLKLRLACAYEHKSAQAVVTAALDQYLAENFPDTAKGGPKVVAG